jgi:predicted ABC-type ATPase
MKVSKNYIITLIFIFLDNEKTCIERVTARVDKGGHHVPESDIRRRFGRSMVNFWNEYRFQAHRWVLHYNTEDSFQEVANKMKKSLYIYDESLFDLFKLLVNNHE